MFTQEKKNDNNKKFIYLDREKLNSIPFQIDLNSTNETLLLKYQDILKSRIYPLYNKDIEDCYFLIIETKISSKKDDIPSFIELKINKKTKIFNLLQNPQYNLYFLPKKKTNIQERQKARNTLHLSQNFYEEAENNYFLIKPTEEYLTKANILLYDSTKQILTKEKGSVDKNKITIFKNGNRDSIEILIKDIIKDLYYNDVSPASYRKNLPIKGDRPKFYIEIQTNKKTYFFAQFKESLNTLWENAIKKAITKYKNFNLELNLDIKINSSKTSLYATSHSIIDSCFIINKILFNEDKRKMFFANFPGEKIGSIISNIIMYKDSIKKNKYLETWMRFKEILTYIESYYINNKKDNQIIENRIIEEDNLNSLFTEERIKKYKKVSEDADENAKKIKIEESSLFLFQNEIKNALNEIMKEDLFDDIFYYLYNLYVVKYFEEIKQILQNGSIPTEKPIIRQKFQFLLALYFTRIICNMNQNDYNVLYSKIKSENGELRTESLTNPA